MSQRRVNSVSSPSRGGERYRRLEAVIKERITSRLGRRIRNLCVTVDRGVILLVGECSTYYSKQLAQHAALGVVEDEEIENRIEVAVPHRN